MSTPTAPHCNICQESFPPHPVQAHEPLALTCGHIFCRSCVEQNAGRSACAVCNRHIDQGTSRTLRLSYILRPSTSVFTHRDTIESVTSNFVQKRVAAEARTRRLQDRYRKRERKHKNLISAVETLTQTLDRVTGEVEDLNELNDRLYREYRAELATLERVLQENHELEERIAHANTIRRVLRRADPNVSVGRGVNRRN